MLFIVRMVRNIQRARACVCVQHAELLMLTYMVHLVTTWLIVSTIHKIRVNSPKHSVNI
jgi:hypothetical protein